MKSQDLFISIIIPSFNQGSFISRTIESILKQEHKNFEIIIIDGGSTDNTVDVVNSFSNEIDIFITEVDDGQSDAINKGISMSKGDIVGWINSDDTFSPGAFSKITNEFINTPNLGFIYGNINIIDQNDNITGFLKGNVCYMPEVSWKLDLPIPQQGSFWRRKLMEVNKLKLNVDFNFVLDRDIFIRTLIKLEVKYINYTLGNFRHHETSKSILQVNKWLGEMPVLYEKLIEDFKGLHFTNSDILKIRAMLNLYNAIEYFKIGRYTVSLNYFLISLFSNPSVLITSGFVSKFSKFFTISNKRDSIIMKVKAQ
jgi:glycosyltransferase involved in cell wall biosynthesis